MQSRQIAVLDGQLGIAEIKPDPTLLHAVQFVKAVRSNAVEPAKKFAKIFGIMPAACNNMIVIGKHRPRFQLPAVFFYQGQQETLKQITFGWGVEKMLFVEGTGSYKIDGILRQTMNRRMRPIFWR